MPAEPLVKVTRGPLVESVHRGHIAVADADGNLLYGFGIPRKIVFARSAAKPLQAIPVIESGAADAFGFEDCEIALLCASHNGEPEHVAAVESMLGKLGLTVDALECGAHEPLYNPAAVELIQRQLAPSRLHNNCSGKHAGMLALAKRLGVPYAGYPAPDHPVQRRILQAVSELCGVPRKRVRLGVDGCGVPVFGVPLRRLAAAYARLGTPGGLSAARADACRRIVAGVRAYPRGLAGTGRFDTRLVEATGGRIIGKMGAEGVFAVTVPGRGLGIALKVEDGAQRALYAATAETLRQLDLLLPQELEALAEFHRPRVTNWSGAEVGEIIPDFQLRPVSRVRSNDSG